MAEILQEFGRAFTMAISSDQATIKRAEEVISTLQKDKQFGIWALRFIAEQSVPAELRFSCAISFKNYCKNKWTDSEKTDAQCQEEIKNSIISIALNSIPVIQRQLSAAITIIAEAEFPWRWRSLLDELVHPLSSNDPTTLCRVLEIASSVFQRFRSGQDNDDLRKILQEALAAFQVPLLNVFMTVIPCLSQTDPRAVAAYLEIVARISDVFVCLNTIDIPEYFEDHIEQWMTGFLTMIEYRAPQAVDSQSPITYSADGGETITRLMQSKVCDAITLYMDRYEEEFGPFVPKFVDSCWKLLSSLGFGEDTDKLAAGCVAFLTSVARSSQHSFFGNEAVLGQMLSSVIIPNLLLREVDVELFEESPAEYIRKDLEGSDVESRRRSACEFIKGLCKNYDAQVTTLGMNLAMSLLRDFESDPNKWTSRDAALFLISSLAVKGQTAAFGATQLSPLIDTASFLQCTVIPLLRSTGVVLPAGVGGDILRSDALRIVVLFRNHIPNEALYSIVPDLARLLNGGYVVSTYAAHALEKLLTIKDAQTPGHPRKIRREHLQASLGPLLQTLFALLSKGKTREEQENHYVMKAIMRLTAISETDIVPYAATIVSELNVIVGRCIPNPSNPMFVHFLFETMASLINYICRNNVPAVESFENMLFPPFRTILALDVSEFTTYVFQILSQLLEARPAPIPKMYMDLFEPLLTPQPYENRGNIPSLVRLLQAFLEKGITEIVAQNKLAPVLGVYRNLLNSRTRDQYAFTLVEVVLKSVPQNDIQPFITPLYQVALDRFMALKTPKFALQLTHLLLVGVSVYGAVQIRILLDGIQQGLWFKVCQGIVAKNLAAFTEDGTVISVIDSPARASIDNYRNEVAVGLVSFLFESGNDVYQWQAFPQVLEKFIDFWEVVQTGKKMGPKMEHEQLEEEGITEELYADDDGAYSTSYVPLHFASKERKPLFPHAANMPLSRYIGGKLEAINASTGGLVMQSIGRAQEAASRLQQLLSL